MSTLNLPLAYNQLSQYFDVLGCSSSHWNQVIEKILKKHRVQTVLDLTCGTGSQVIWLAKRGFQVTGSDLSPNLLTIAKRKARIEQVKVRFSQGDMRTQRINHFDAVITIFNAIGHLTKAGFEKAIKNIHRNLNPGGLYVFDIFNAESLDQQTLSAMRTDQTKIISHQHIHHLQYSRLDKKQNHLISYDYFFLQTDLDKPKLIQGQFSLQIYTLKQLQEMLAKNGFKILEQYGVDGSKFSAKKTREMLVVAQKI